MEKEMKYGLMELIIRENTMKAKNMEKEGLSSLMVQFMKVILIPMICMEMENTFGLTKEFMKDNGKTIKWMASVV